MAKVKRTSKSETIRTYLRTHSNGSPAKVVAELKAQGVEVSRSHVSVIKSKLKGAGSRRGDSRRAGLNGGVRVMKGHQRPQHRSIAALEGRYRKALEARRAELHEQIAELDRKLEYLG